MRFSRAIFFHIFFLFVAFNFSRAQSDIDPSLNDTKIQWLSSFWEKEYEGKLVTEAFPVNRIELLAKAAPDEKYFGIGHEDNLYSPLISTNTSEWNKTNQAYIWGLAKSGNNLWFGTIANTHCLVMGGMAMAGLGMLHPSENPFWVCEYGESQFSPPMPDGVGDWRPPRMFLFNILSDNLTEITPKADARLKITTGIRSAAAIGDIVLFAGPGILGGINVFAFNANTKAYLGSKTLIQYSNIRKFVTINGVLYTSVGASGGGGKVLRWSGSLADPFQFTVVGNIDAPGAYLCCHNNRIYVNTWPELASGVIAGVWKGPVIPAGGLTASNANQWQKVWNYSMYDPDAVTAATYGGGPIFSFGGKLYWGTMHVPMTAAMIHLLIYPPASQTDILLAVLGTQRAISIFRTTDFIDPPEAASVELLYGNTLLPAYTPGPGWEIVPNKMSQIPKYGLAGFWNFFNNYTWTMEEFNGQLYVGTMDWSLLMAVSLWDMIHNLYSDYLDPSVPIDYSIESQLELPEYFFGADLWRFPNNILPALPENISGVGNIMNYGIRSMLPADNLYLGSANPMNLSQKPKTGGWELIKLSPIIYKEEPKLPDDFTITLSNYPNPFNNETTIKYSLPFEAKIKIELFNSLGENVKVLSEGISEPGDHDVICTAGNLCSGTYFAVMQITSLADNTSFRKVAKIVLIK